VHVVASPKLVVASECVGTMASAVLVLMAA
jgi:hypothetical protein